MGLHLYRHPTSDEGFLCPCLLCSRSLSFYFSFGPRELGPVLQRGSPVLWTEERVPEPALAHNHTDEYFAYRHRTLIWRWMEMEAETHVGTLDLALLVQMRGRRKENVSKEGKGRGNLHPTLDGDRDRDPHWNTGLTSLGPNEKQKESEREQRSQDQRETSSDVGWRYRRRPILEYQTEHSTVQMRSRRMKKMKKEIRTAMGAITH